MPCRWLAFFLSVSLILQPWMGVLLAAGPPGPEIPSYRDRLREKEYILWPKFSSGSAELSRQDRVMLTGLATHFKSFQILHIDIIGHTDNVPIANSQSLGYPDNMALSLARAQSVGRLLQELLGISESQISVRGVGDTSPLVSNDTEEGRAQNRRVQVQIQLRESIVPSSRNSDTPEGALAGVAGAGLALPPLLPPGLPKKPSPVPPFNAQTRARGYVDLGYRDEVSIQPVPPRHTEFFRKKRWAPQFNATVKAGTDRSIGRFSLMWPLLEGPSSLAFADARAVFSDNGRLEGNFGLGYRRIQGGDHGASRKWIWGLYGFYDHLSSSNEAAFSQITLGGEVLTEHFELRANAYLPENDHHVIESTSSRGVELVGTTVTVRTTTIEAREVPLTGGDIEAGYGFGLGKGILWTHAGYFLFDHELAPQIAGPRVRVRYELPDPFSIPGGSLGLGLQFQEDDVRGEELFAFAGIRIPLDRVFDSLPEFTTPPGIESRMLQPIVRDIDIVTFEQDMEMEPGSDYGPTIVYQDEQPVKDPVTGEVIDLFFVNGLGSPLADGTRIAPMTIAQAEAAAGRSDILFLLNDGGDIDVSATLGGTLRLKENQQIVGVGDGAERILSFAGLEPDQTLSIRSSSGRPVLARGTGSDVVLLGNGNRMEGIGLAGGSSGVRGNAVAGLKMTDTLISGSEGAGLSLFGASGTVQVDGSRIFGTAGPAVQITGGSATLAFTANHLTQSGGRVLEIDGTAGQVSFSGGSIANSGGNGVMVQNLPQSGHVTLEGLGLTDVTGSAITLAANDGSITIDGAVITTGGSGTGMIVQGGSGKVAVTGSTLNQTTGGRALDISGRTGGEVDLTGLAIDNRLGTGIRLTGNAGSIALSNLDISDSIGAAVDIQGGNGLVSFSAARLQNASDAVFRLSGGSNSVSFSGEILQQSSGGRTLDIENTAGGSVRFTGGSVSDQGGTGIRLAGNAGSIRIDQADLNPAAGSAAIQAGGNNSSVVIASGEAATAAGSPVFSFTNSSGNYDFSGLISRQSGTGLTFTNGNSGVYKLGDVTVSEPGSTAVWVSGSSAQIEFARLNASGFTGSGIDLDNLAGSFTVRGGTIGSTSGTAVDIAGGGGAVTFTGTTIQQQGGRLLSIAGTTGGSVSFSGAPLTNVGGTGILLQDTAGSVSIAGADLSGGVSTPVTIAGNTGSVSFTGATVVAPTNFAALDLDPGSGAITFAGGSIRSSGSGAALDLDGGAGSLTFDGVQFQAGKKGLDLAGGTGAVTFRNGSLIQNGGQAVSVDGGSRQIDMTGLTITNQNTSESSAIDIRNTAGGSIRFGTVDITGLGGGQTAVNLAANAAAVSFTDLDIQALNGSGLASVDQAGKLTWSKGTVAVTNGTALDLVRTSSDIRLTTLSASNSSVNGIRLEDLTGALTISGTTAVTNATGASISVAGGDADLIFGKTDIRNRNSFGIQIEGTGGLVRFGQLTIDNGHNSAADAVNIRNTTGGNIEMASGGHIDLNGAMAAGIRLSENTGSFTLTGVTVERAGEACVSLEQSSGTFGLYLSNSTIRSLNTGVLIRSLGTADVTTSLNGNSIESNGSGIDLQTGGAGLGRFTIVGNALNGLGADFSAQSLDSSLLYLDLRSNTAAADAGVDFSLTSGGGIFQLKDYKNDMTVPEFVAGSNSGDVSTTGEFTGVVVAP